MLAAALFVFLLFLYLLTYSGAPHNPDEWFYLDGTQAALRGDAAGVQAHGWLFSWLIAPFYALSMLVPGTGSFQAALLLNIVITAATATFLYLALAELNYSTRLRLAAGLAYGLCTLAWPYSHYLFREPAAGLALLVATWGVLRFWRAGRLLPLLAAAVAFVCAVAVKQTTLAFLPVYGVVGLAWVYRSVWSGHPSTTCVARPGFARHGRSSAQDGSTAGGFEQLPSGARLATAVAAVLVGVLALVWPAGRENARGVDAAPARNLRRCGSAPGGLFSSFAGARHSRYRRGRIGTAAPGRCVVELGRRSALHSALDHESLLVGLLGVRPATVGSCCCSAVLPGAACRVCLAGGSARQRRQSTCGGACRAQRGVQLLGVAVPFNVYTRSAVRRQCRRRGCHPELGALAHSGDAALPPSAGARFRLGDGPPGTGGYRLLLAPLLAGAVLAGGWLLWVARRRVHRGVSVMITGLLLVGWLVLSVYLLRYVYLDERYTPELGYPAAAQTVAEQTRPGDVLITDLWTENLTGPAVALVNYCRGGCPPRLDLTRENLTDREQDWQARHAADLAEYDRAWLVLERVTEGDANSIVERWLGDIGYGAGCAWRGPQVRLCRYDLVAGAPVAPETQQARFGAGIELTDVEIRLRGQHAAAGYLLPGETVQAALAWRADQPPDADIVLSLQLLRGDGQLAAGLDHRPGNGFRPVSGWQPGERITDRLGVGPAALDAPRQLHAQRAAVRRRRENV